MGSYNTSCAITGLPITGREGEDLTLVYYTVDRRASTYDRVRFLGTTFKGVYDDCGRLDTESNPLVTVLGPSEDNDAGFILASQGDTAVDCADTLWLRGLNLWTLDTDLLHFYHDLVEIPAKAALQRLKDESLSVGLPESFNDFSTTSTFDETSSTSVAAKYPLAVARLKELLGETPLKYNDRAALVHALLDSERESSSEASWAGAEFVSNGEFDLSGFLHKVLPLLKVSLTHGNLQAAAKLAKENLLCKIELAVMHTSAYRRMVKCARKQLGAAKAKVVEDFVRDSLAEHYADLENFKRQKEALGEHADTERMKRLLRRLTSSSKSSNGPCGYSIPQAFAGKVPAEVTEDMLDLAMFELNFSHGFKFSSMTENRQYEGIAHIEAQAKSTLEVLAARKPSLYKSGNWDTYMYSKK